MLIGIFFPLHLHVVCSLPQTNTANTKWFLDYHKMYGDTHALQGLQHNSNSWSYQVHTLQRPSQNILDLLKIKMCDIL